MKIEGQQTIAAPRDRVWTTLMENGRFAQAAPHYQLLNSSIDNQFHGTLSVGVGPLRGEHALMMRLSQIKSPVALEMEFDGKSGLGTFAGNGRIRLDTHDQTTTIHYEGDITVTDQLAELPPRLLQANINAIIRRTIETIRAMLWPEQYTVEIPLSSRTASIQKPQNSLVIGLFALAGSLTVVLIGKALFSKKTKPSA